MLNEPDPHEPGSVLPYIVSLDKTDRMISAPYDDDACVRLEVCFTEAEWRVSRSLSAGRTSLALRFSVGDEVACLTRARDGSASAEWSRARPLGPRADRSRFVTRQRADGGGFEELDHQTRVVRSMQPAAPAPAAGKPEEDGLVLCGACEE